MNFVRLITIACALVVFAVSGQSTSKKTDSKAAAAADLIDINRADAAHLKALPGIGDAYAAAIIKGRPYKNKTQLLSNNVIPPATYKKISAKIIAKQP